MTDYVTARQWTIYVAVQADGFYNEALSVIDQFETALSADKKGAIKACIEVITGTSVTRYLFEHGVKKELIASLCRDRLEQLKKGAIWAFSDAMQGRTALIVSGHGTGIINPLFDKTRKRWLYQSDDGPSPSKVFCSDRSAVFSKEIEHIMDGKSFLIAEEGSSFISVQGLNEITSSVKQLLHRKIDIIGFDSCYMAMLEIAYELKDSGVYFVASQECEDKDGWNYTPVLNALLSNSSIEHIVRQCAYGYDRVQRTKGIGRYSLSVFDLSCVFNLAKALDSVVDSCMTVSAENKSLLKTVCAARLGLHKMCGLPFYADLGEFLESFLAELSELKRTPEIEQLVLYLIEALEALHTTLVASVCGRHCIALQGCSIYFPLANIDSSYQGNFVNSHQWGSLLKWFTKMN